MYLFMGLCKLLLALSQPLCPSTFTTQIMIHVALSRAIHLVNIIVCLPLYSGSTRHFVWRGTVDEALPLQSRDMIPVPIKNFFRAN